MQKYRQNSLIRTGFIGLVVIVLIIAVGMGSQQLLTTATSIRYQALFAEAGGLTSGNEVKVSGVTVGNVTDVALEHGRAKVTFAVDGKVRLGRDTTAHIGIGTLLGERVLVLEPRGSGSLGPLGVIPLTRTASPYSLTDAVGEFTANTAQTDTAAINHALDTLSDTIERLSPQLAPTFDGVARLSRSLNQRNESLRELLAAAADVTGLLSERSQQVNTLLLNANDLLAVLRERRHAIANLLANTTAVARELSRLVDENEAELAPALEQINAVAEVLERNHDNLEKSLRGMAKYQLTLGEAVNNGFYYYGFASNLLPGPAIQPFLDYALGFRRGVNAGQPPDNAGPRAEFPFPYNGIPEKHP
ncbi:MCE family protein [uncultured Mycolicibacterium sp.]|uniref:MCE family protein n=1 Tax=uncultured Mycolicibacterium sp. TaxID=2320817 RepID=UPI0026083064|nr:MCE family protein [uncultured Mycolicibacterium sp.]